MSNPTDYLVSDDLPPPYSPNADASDIDPSSPRLATGPQSPSLFSSHLASIRSQIAAEQAARTSAREHHDTYVLSLLVPHVEDLLSSIAGIHPPPTLVEATIVPDQAVDRSWTFSDEEEKRQGEVRKLIKVGQHSKLAAEKGAEKGASYDSQTGSPLWWSDESMARRLGRLLQPSRPVTVVNRQPVSRPRDETQGRRSSLWGLFKKEEPTTQSRVSNRQPASPTGSPAQQSGEGVTMTVKAEEVTFRKENAFGLWETTTGWGIVIRVRIRHC
ncbi:hypothetical protein PT974_05381 [Cladobotryum mycophilum]|uniref:Uncharacterized protein n=1 Tax=Cladobotryum mycophilum TaxID=491253 RepID=A0ABR0SJP3_9HYPO